MKITRQGWITIAFCYFLLLFTIMLLADLGLLTGIIFILSQPPYDKLGHFILYGIGSFVIHRAMNKRQLGLGNYILPSGPLIFTGVTIFEEGLQSILPNRSASLEDLICSLLGILLFYLVGEKIDRLAP